jgi:hypothetical protein
MSVSARERDNGCVRVVGAGEPGGYGHTHIVTHFLCLSGQHQTTQPKCEAPTTVHNSQKVKHSVDINVLRKRGEVTHISNFGLNFITELYK